MPFSDPARARAYSRKRRAMVRREPLPRVEINVTRKIRSDYGHDGPEVPVGKEMSPCSCGGRAVVPFNDVVVDKFKRKVFKTVWRCRRCGARRDA